MSSWYLLWLKKANKDYLSYQLAINLEKTLEEIRLSFRKSYKPLVNKALREWDVDVCSKETCMFLKNLNYCIKKYQADKQEMTYLGIYKKTNPEWRSITDYS